MRLTKCNLRQQRAIMAPWREEERDSMSWRVLVPALEHLDSSWRVHIAQSSLPTMHRQQELPERLDGKASSQSPMAKDSVRSSPQNAKGASD